MKRIGWIVLVGVLSIGAALSGYQMAGQSPGEQAASSTKEFEQRLVELGLTEDQIQDTIISGVQAFIQEQQQAQRDAQAQSQQEQAARLRPASEQDDFIRGNTDAEFSMIEYSDFECPFCKRFHDTAVSFTENNESVNWVHRHFPLDNHNPQASSAAIGAECVGHQLGDDAYWAFTDQYYSDTRSGGRGLPDVSVSNLMVALGMSADEAASCLNDLEMQARVQQQMAEGQAAGVTGTPGIFIRHNPTGEVMRVPGAVPLPDLQNRFDQFQAQL